METKILTTNAPVQPKAVLGAKHHWKCVTIRPQTGRPVDAKGNLILTYVWESTPNHQPKPIPENQPRRTPRGVMVEQADLFGK